MLIEELRIKLENKVFNSVDTIKVETLIEAINDWPSPINSLNEYLEKIKSDLSRNEITYNVIKKISSKLNPATQAWKMESYASLMKLMELDNYKTLNEIIGQLDNPAC